ncbi:GATA transcription factor 2 [Iris pallida]|uniref:GATA transcription factor n=1 Tax=Iris pallida TaxID=29817 RepID=A0AAX6FCF5_IRIPA|nr:GATA transcription factor 2 [Iris pallida]
MAPEWELGMGNGNNSTPSYMYGLPSADTLRIDDLLDFSNHELFPSAADGNQILNQHNASAAGRDSGSSSDLYPQLSSSFADNIYIPSEEEAAELEWLSKFVEDSFSDIPYPSASIPTNHISVSNAQIAADSSSNPSRGVRSKRSRAPAAAANWSSPQAVIMPVAQSSSSSTSSSSSCDFPHNARKRSSGAESGIGVDESGVRRCTHCASEKTPQWRTGPLGPKTLCNACGVRFKSGRLVPEYRPAASPTFVLTQHSNSHRKVMELRRQKEVHQHQHQHHHHRQQQQQLIYHDRVMSLS